MADRTEKTLSTIARGVELGSAGLTLLERIVALFRPKSPEAKADQLRERAAGAKSATRRKRLLKRADRLAPTEPVAASAADETTVACAEVAE